jgi:hypothetical protein
VGAGWRQGVLLALAALCVTARLGAAERNLIPNGGFEAAPTEITGWRVFNLVGAGFSAGLDERARSGTRALRLVRETAGGDAGVDLWDQPPPVTPGQEVLLRFAARRIGGEARSRLHVSAHEFSISGALLAEGQQATSFDPPTAAYAEFTWRLRLVSPLTAHVSIGFRLGDADGGLAFPGAFLIDDVALLAEGPDGGGSGPGREADPGAGQSDVRVYGAKGDGVTDDTAAFQQALNARYLAGGGTVFVPPGRYRIASHLLVPRAVTLRGVWEAPPIPVSFTPPGEPPRLAGSILLAIEGAGKPEGPPFISLDANACLRGVTIVYPDQTPTNPPIAYPWTVASAGADNCSIIDVLMLNPYQAVDFGSRASGRHYVRGLYADPLYRGLYIDQCLDVGRVENVHFWPFYDPNLEGPLRAFVLANCEAFVIGRTDWEYLTNCFAFGQHIGFHFIRGNGTGPYTGPGNVLMTQTGADMADMSILVDELQGHSGMLVSNSQFFGDVVVGERNVGPMRFSNCGFYGSIHGRRGVAQALLEGNGSVSFQNCHFISLHPANQAPVAILARHGTLSLQGCEFMTPGRAQVRLEPGVRRAVIVGNQFAGRAEIVNQAQGKTEIGMNVDDAPPPEPGVILVDDSDDAGGFSRTGTWNPASGAGNFMQSCLWAAPGAAGTQAEWRAEIPAAGRYAVEIWYGPDPNGDHATKASYTVRHADGATTLQANLRENTARWNRLGVFRFAKGTPGVVVLAGDADGNLLADAVRFVPVQE